MTDFNIDVVVDPRSAQRGSRAVRRELDRAADSGTRLKGALTGALAVLGSGALAGSSIRLLADFSQQMSTVAAVTGATESQFRALTAEAQRLGTTTRFSGSQAAEGIVFLARAGFDAQESLEGVSATLLLAQAGALSLGSAADIASNILTGFRLEVSDLNRVVDVLALASNSANTNVQQLGIAMQFVAPVAAGLNVSIEEATAAIGALSDAGLQGSLAGTGLRRVLSELESPSSRTSEILRVLGITTDQVRVSQVGLASALQTLADAGVDTGIALEIFGDRGGPAFEVLSSAIPRVRDLIEALREADGTAERIADTMDDNLNGALLAVRSALEGIVIGFGELGAEDQLADFFNDLAGALRIFADNLDLVVEVGADLAILLGARLVASFVASRAAALNSAAATLENARATRESAASALAAAAAEREYIQFQQQSLASQLQLTRTESTRNAIRRQLSANSAALVAATQAEAVATQNLATAQAAASTSARTLNAASRALRGTLALLGGPTGIILLTVSAFVAFTSSVRDADDEIGDFRRNVDKLSKDLEKLTEAQIGLNIINLEDQLRDLNTLRNEVESNIRDIESAIFFPGTRAAFPEEARTRQLTEARARLDTVTQTLTDTQEQLIRQQERLGALQRGEVEVGDPLGGEDGGTGSQTGGVGAPVSTPIDLGLLEVLNNLERETELLRLNSQERQIREDIFKIEDELGRRLTAGERERIQGILESNQALREQNDVLESLRGPQDQLDRDLEAAVTLYERNAISGQEFADTLRDIRLAQAELNIERGEGSFADGFILEIERMTEAVRNFESESGAILGEFTNTAVSGFSRAAAEAVAFGSDFKTSVGDIARQALADLLASLIQLGLQFVINAALGKTLGASTTAAGVAQAATLSAAYATPAALASLASFGANAAPASAGLASTVALSNALSAVPGFQTGGEFIVGGSGGPDSQLVQFRGTPGERVTIQTPGQQAQAQPSESQQSAPVIANFVDRQLFEDFLGTRQGQRALVNAIGNNSGTINQALRGS